MNHALIQMINYATLKNKLQHTFFLKWCENIFYFHFPCKVKATLFKLFLYYIIINSMSFMTM
jgi:hypothetical protein